MAGQAYKPEKEVKNFEGFSKSGKAGTKRTPSIRTSKNIGRTIEYEPNPDDPITLSVLSDQEFWALFALRVYCLRVPPAGPERRIVEPSFGLELKYIPFPFNAEEFAEEFYSGRKRIWKKQIEKATLSLVQLSSKKFGLPVRGFLIPVDFVNILLTKHWVEYYEPDIHGIATEEDLSLIIQNGAFIRVAELLIKPTRFFKKMENILPVLNMLPELKNDFSTKVQLLRLYEFLTNWSGTAKRLTRDFKKMALILNLNKHYKSRHTHRFIQRLEKILGYALTLDWISNFKIDKRSKKVVISLKTSTS